MSLLEGLNERMLHKTQTCSVLAAVLCVALGCVIKQYFLLLIAKFQNLSVKMSLATAVQLVVVQSSSNNQIVSC